jgi:hypothetical protein
MDSTYLPTVYRVVSHVTGTDIGLLTDKTRFSEVVTTEDEFHEIYEQCCEELGVSLPLILNSMPMYRQKLWEFVLSSLRNLAPFNKRADALLAKHDVQIEDETLGSLAQSMRENAYVSSGEYWPPENPPRSKTYVISWALGLLAAAVIFPYLFTLAPCSMVGSKCILPTWWQMRKMLPFTVSGAGLIIAFAYVPGLLLMAGKGLPKPTLAELRKE